MKSFGRTISCLAPVAFLLAGTDAFARNCSKDEWYVQFAAPNATTGWKVVRGTACSSLARTGINLVDNYVIINQPRHGVAGVTNGIADRGFAYKANGDYTGPDEFQVGCQMHATWQTEPIRCTITVKVTVVEKL